MAKYQGVDQHGKGWRARWYDENGKRQVEEGFPTARDASEYRDQQKAQAAKIKRERRLGFAVNSIPEWTMDEAFAEWITEVKEPELAETTIVTIRNNYRKHISPTFGEMHPRAINTEMIKRWQRDKVASGLSVTTVRGLRSKILSGLFRWMIATRDQGMANPLAGAKSAQPTVEQMKAGAHNADPTRVLGESEVMAFYEAWGQIEPRFLAMIEVGLNTGLRPQELYALRPEVINRGINPYISIERAITIENGKPTPTERLKGEPRSRVSRRDVFVAQSVIDAIDAHIAEFGLSDEGYIFSMPSGKMIDGQTLVNRSNKHSLGLFTQAAKHAGLETHDTQAEKWKNITPYTLRHTNISWRLAAGQDMAFIQQQVGHTIGSRVTFAHYVRVVPGTEAASLAKVAPVMARREIAPVIPLRAKVG